MTEVDALSFLFVVDEFADVATAVLGHVLHYAVAFGMHGSVVQRMLAVGDTQKSSTLLIGCRS